MRVRVERFVGVDLLDSSSGDTLIASMPGTVVLCGAGSIVGVDGVGIDLRAGLRVVRGERAAIIRVGTGTRLATNGGGTNAGSGSQ